MKDTCRFFCCLVLLLPAAGQSQGIVTFTNVRAPTHIGSIDGPLAGLDYGGELFVGLTPDSLAPIPPSSPHFVNGVVIGGAISIPYAFPGDLVYVQMAAWNGSLWGTDVEQAPPSQIGLTDIVPVFATIESPPIPPFTRSAIVPPVPEPSVWALMLCGRWCLGMAAEGRPEKALCSNISGCR